MSGRSRIRGAHGSVVNSLALHEAQLANPVISMTPPIPNARPPTPCSQPLAPLPSSSLERTGGLYHAAPQSSSQRSMAVPALHRWCLRPVQTGYVLSRIFNNVLQGR